jgi:hypothetical protein
MIEKCGWLAARDVANEIRGRPLAADPLIGNGSAWRLRRPALAESIGEVPFVLEKLACREQRHGLRRRAVLPKQRPNATLKRNWRDKPKASEEKLR